MQKYYTAVGRFERKGRMGDMTCPRAGWVAALLWEQLPVRDNGFEPRTGEVPQ